MKKSQNLIIVILMALIAVLALCLFDDDVSVAPAGGFSGGAVRSSTEAVLAADVAEMEIGPSEDPKADDSEAAVTDDADDVSAQSPEEVETPDVDEEAAKVEAFDALTDKWMEVPKGEVTMDDVDAFAQAFRQIPKERQDECIHRALNLIPDENVMLLAGILLDKSMDKEIVETVFHDILNRDEGVKKPILSLVLKDKDHPCQADTAWILDMTGDLPVASGE